MVRRVGEGGGATTLHYVVEDELANRGSLRPNDVAERYTGHEVVVVGSFRDSEREGRSIEIMRIEGRDGRPEAHRRWSAERSRPEAW